MIVNHQSMPPSKVVVSVHAVCRVSDFDSFKDMLHQQWFHTAKHGQSRYLSQLDEFDNQSDQDVWCDSAKDACNLISKRITSTMNATSHFKSIKWDIPHDAREPTVIMRMFVDCSVQQKEHLADCRFVLTYGTHEPVLQDIDMTFLDGVAGTSHADVCRISLDVMLPTRGLQRNLCPHHDISLHLVRKRQDIDESLTKHPLVLTLISRRVQADSHAISQPIVTDLLLRVHHDEMNTTVLCDTFTFDLRQMTQVQLAARMVLVLDHGDDVLDTLHMDVISDGIVREYPSCIKCDPVTVPFQQTSTSEGRTYYEVDLTGMSWVGSCKSWFHLSSLKQCNITITFKTLSMHHIQTYLQQPNLIDYAQGLCFVRTR
jgi:hypothetical protein